MTSPDPTPPAVEIAVTSPAGARAAIAGGADRVELCTALELGGLTPSLTMTEEAVATGIPVQVLIRCRPGGFVYSPEEIGWMADEAARAVVAGAAGVVIGALTTDGRIDLPSLHRLSAAARAVDPGTQVTFHRAIDQLRDPAAHLEDLAAAGIDRILTSGGAPTVDLGLRQIAAMLDRGTGIEVMAGGGISPETLRSVLAVGVHAVHLSAKKAVRQTSPHWIPVGSTTAADGDVHYRTDASLVRETVRTARNSG
ncbi:copper homeostasis protein CutC [Arthrobacter sp. B0490]|uniref:copper homeostasis protein CutC n=1 Tax=Arthrobacter sp. B0490 TaxID=2058891 RepID=UPI000CE4623E|nr:copper homeostasis protein CutC [Arthrobacter sp. B0490]